MPIGAYLSMIRRLSCKLYKVGAAPFRPEPDKKTFIVLAPGQQHEYLLWAGFLDNGTDAGASAVRMGTYYAQAVVGAAQCGCTEMVSGGEYSAGNYNDGSVLNCQYQKIYMRPHVATLMH